MYRRSHLEVFYKEGVHRNFAKFTGKHLYQSLFFNKVSENMLQIYRRTPMSKCDLNKVALHCFATLLKSHFGMGVLL